MCSDHQAARWPRAPRVVPSWTDLTLALCAVVLGVISVHYRLEAARSAGDTSGPGSVVSYGMIVALSATLVVRRVVPIASFMAAVALFCALRLAEVAEPTVSVIVLAGSYVNVGVHGSRRWRGAARIVATAGFVGVYVFEAVRVAVSEALDESFRSLLVLDVAFSVAIIGSAWFIGEVLRSRAELTDTLRLRTEQLERERGNAERLAVADERIRIARELHDVLAHHVSVMGLQAVAAGRVLDRRPDDARSALAIVERSSRAAVDEMRQLIGFLRADEFDDTGGGPHPSISDIHDLVESTRALGIDATLTIRSVDEALPPGVDLAVFRIVQEALTNVHKHSGATAVTVTLEHCPDRIEISVEDNGSSAREPAGAHGMGLRGIRERVRLHEGSCDLGPTTTGGWRVHASFPLRHPS